MSNVFITNRVGLLFKKLCKDRFFSNFKKSSPKILGIETSCDDTGCAVVDIDGNILGHALSSQHLTHLNNGGIIPPIAQLLHRQNIEKVVNDAVIQSNIDFNEIDAIATTIKPGLPLSLMIGMKYGMHLCGKYKKPFIPIHHMEAHALTARMTEKKLQFPFLVLLISGGHCLLAVAQDINKFQLLGESIDEAPGEAFDKMSRRLKLRNIPEYANLNGGRAIELAASKATDPNQFDFTIPLLQYKDCNFSFAGMKNTFLRHLINEENKHDVPPDGVIPTANNLSAGFLLNLTRHLCHRVQRGAYYACNKGLIPENRQILVVSGGVACNNFIYKALKIVCDAMDYGILRPPPELCTDNGVMIAWNGVEKWKKNVDVFHDFGHIEIEKSSQLGVNLIEDVRNENLRCKWIKLGGLFNHLNDEKRELCKN